MVKNKNKNKNKKKNEKYVGLGTSFENCFVLWQWWCKKEGNKGLIIRENGIVLYLAHFYM